MYSISARKGRMEYLQLFCVFIGSYSAMKAVQAQKEEEVVSSSDDGM